MCDVQNKRAKPNLYFKAELACPGPHKGDILDGTGCLKHKSSAFRSSCSDRDGRDIARPLIYDFRYLTSLGIPLLITAILQVHVLNAGLRHDRANRALLTGAIPPAASKHTYDPRPAGQQDSPPN